MGDFLGNSKFLEKCPLWFFGKIFFHFSVFFWNKVKRVNFWGSLYLKSSMKIVNNWKIFIRNEIKKVTRNYLTGNSIQSSIIMEESDRSLFVTWWEYKNVSVKNHLNHRFSNLFEFLKHPVYEIYEVYKVFFFKLAYACNSKTYR